MYSISTETVFRGKHHLVVGGEVEKAHEHDWRVRVTVEATELDESGLVMDFCRLAELLAAAVEPLGGAESINNVPGLSGQNPSAEVVGRYVYERIGPRLEGRVRLAEVAVEESPGCWAKYCE